MKQKKEIENFGLIIKKARTKQKMSRETLSIKLMIEGLNISAQSIYKIENNKRKLKSNEIKILTKVLKIIAQNN